MERERKLPFLFWQNNGCILEVNVVLYTYEIFVYKL